MILWMTMVAWAGPMERAEQAMAAAQALGEPQTLGPAELEAFRGHLRQAHVQVTKDVKKHGPTPANQLVLAKIGYGLQDREGTLASLLWLTANHPSDAFAWWMLAQIYELADNDPAAGLRLFARAVAANPTNASLHLGYADRLLLVAGDVDGAETAYQRALELAPESPSRAYLEGRLAEIAAARLRSP